MAGKKQKLEVDQDLDFQKKDWAFERIGWVFMALVLLAALAGVFGRGPLSDAEALSPDRLARLSYGRFERHGAISELKLVLRRRAATDTSVTVWIGDDYIRHLRIERIVPQPLGERSSGEHTLFEFALAPGADSAHATIQFTPDRVGRRQLRLGVPGGPPLSVSQFVYP